MTGKRRAFPGINQNRLTGLRCPPTLAGRVLLAAVEAAADHHLLPSVGTSAVVQDGKVAEKACWSSLGLVQEEKK